MGLSTVFPLEQILLWQVLESAHHNLPSAAEHTDVVDSYISSEVAEQSIRGPVPHLPQIHISPMGQPGKWRLITDLFSPKGKSIKDAISPQF